MIHIPRILIIADIEGSSRCRSYEASSFLHPEWPEACLGMTLDVQAVVEKLVSNGFQHITVKDFHRTGYNLLPELIDSRARIVQGYKKGPVPGIGHPGQATHAVFLGGHASSGSRGFLPHTLTSRIARLEVNERLMPEIALFSASLAPFGIRPVFFSGCPLACGQAEERIPGIQTYPIEKTSGGKSSDKKGFEEKKWREGLAEAVLHAIKKSCTEVYEPPGPFNAVITFRDGPKVAQKIAGRWGLHTDGAVIRFRKDDMNSLYQELIRICYLTPTAEKITPLALAASNLRGWFGLQWVRRKLSRYSDGKKQ